MIEVKSRFHIQRLFCDFSKDLHLTDIIKPVYLSGIVDDSNDVSIPFFYKVERGYTAVTDLKNSLGAIFSGMKSNVRNEIRRAEREGIKCEYGYWYDEFIPYYNDFCKGRGLDDSITKERLVRYKETLISRAVFNGNILAMHATVIDRGESLAMLLFSCSDRFSKDADLQRIGWANRYLHYKDFEYLQLQGIKTYDWAGVALSPSNPQHTIGQFKLSFGGKLTRTLVLTTPLFNYFYKAKHLLSRGLELRNNKPSTFV